MKTWGNVLKVSSYILAVVILSLWIVNSGTPDKAFWFAWGASMITACVCLHRHGDKLHTKGKP